MNVDVHTLSGAYALDALSAEESDTFREHLAECPACSEEVRELREAAGRLGAAQWAVPPPALRARVLEAAARTPQQPPGRQQGAASSDDASSDAAARRRRRWPGLLAAAAAVLALIGGVVVSNQATDPSRDDLAVAAGRVFEAPDARSTTVETANGGQIRVGVSPSRNEMAVDTRDLPELDRQHVYQLWTVHEDTMVSAQILTDGSTGAAMGLPAEATQVAVTVEPAGGSEQPTSDPIVMVDPASI